MKSFQASVVFCACIIGITALFYSIFRTGFEFSAVIVWQVAGTGLCLTHLPLQLKQFFFKNNHVFWQNHSFLTLLTFVGILLITSLQFWSGIPLVWGLMVSGFLLLIKTLIDFFQNYRWHQSLVVILSGFVIGLWLLNVVWGKHSSSPTLRESIVVGETISKRGTLDIHYHVAFAQMLKTHGVPATGLNGIIRMHYHFGGHWLIGHLSQLFQTSVSETYSLAYPLVIIPFFFSLFLSFVITVRNFIRQKYDQTDTDLSPMFWLLLLILFMGIPHGLYSMGLVGESSLAIQAYGLSLAFFFAFLGILIHFWQYFSENSRANQLVFLFLVIPAVFACVGFSSISTMTVLSGMIGYAFLRLQLYKKSVFLAAMVFMALLFVVTYLNVVETKLFGPKYSGEGNISPFFFYKEIGNLPPLAFLTEFVGYFYLWLYVFTGFYLFRNKLPDWKIKSGFFASLKSFPVEIIWVTAILGLLPTFLLVLGASGGMYFAGVQMWLSGSLVLAVLPWFDYSFFKKKAINYSIGTAFAIVIVLFVYIELRNNINKVFADNLRTRRALVGMTSDFSVTDYVEARFSEDTRGVKPKWDSLYSNLPQQNLVKNPKYRFLKLLESLEKLPLVEKKRSLLYVNQQTIGFDFGFEYCKEFSMVMVAYSGIALLDGLPPEKCGMSLYGFEYHPPRLPDEKRHYTPSQLLKMAREKGFEQILVYQPETITYTLLK
ncbi:MAG: hypothetical protein H7Y04_02460 [Verrucomicrobia bacterium]|nr:hypothetical protein [Cytophagales bacterium]